MKSFIPLIVLLLFSSLSFAAGTEVLPSAAKEERRDVFNLTSYNPVYFLYNVHSSKLQASFKYRLHRDINLYFAYTHLILWDLESESRPFFDVNYNPEFFYRWQFKNNDHIESVDFIPLGHISNGLEGEESRSLDYMAVQANFKYDIQKNVVFRTGLKLRLIGNFDASNETIRDHYGPYELKFTLTGFMNGLVDKGELTAKFYSGGAYGEHLDKGGQEIGVSFRIMGLEITPNFYIQYFHGYDESLRYFNEKQNIVRFGILL